MLPWEKPLTVIDVNRLHYNHCFGCGTANPAGLKMSFTWDGKTATADFVANETHQGWPDTVHGGLLCAILDEAIGWAAWYQGTIGVTGKIVARLKHPVRIGQKMHIEATLVKSTRKVVRSRAVMTLADSTVAAEAVATIYVLPQPLPAGPASKEAT